MARFCSPKMSLIALSVGFALTSAGSAVMAQEAADTTLEAEAVVVKAKKKAPLPAQAVYDEQQIDMQPSLNGTITDLFTGKSQIQYDSNSRNGGLGGEITPSQISIRGGKNWDNNFMIDGMSNNNVMNPSGYETTGPGAQPAADAQSLIIDTDLLESVEMYSENIGAEYGDFTGGVINAKIRDARMDRWHGKITGRFTSDSMASMFKTPDDEEYPNPFAGQQREFTKWSTGITLDGPIVEDKLGMVLSYQRTDSTVPAYSTDSTGSHKRDTTRLNENFMVKLHTMEENDFYVAGTLMYAPYENSLYHSGIANSDYDIVGGGLFANVHTRANLSFGRWTNDLSYAYNESSRDSSGSYLWYWKTVPNGYANWPAYSQSIGSVEGSYGDIDNEQESYTYKSMLDMDAIQLGKSTHKIKLGGELSHKKVTAVYDGLTMFQSTGNAILGNFQGEKTDGIIAGEQAFNKKVVVKPYDASESYTTAALFVEDTITIDNVTLRPGVRASYDTITKDINIAPRLFADLDILGDNRYHVNAGYNRYYGSQLLTYVTNIPWRQWGFNPTYTRQLDATTGTVGEWTQTRPDTDAKWTMNPDELETPYTDEFTLGASADIQGTVVSLQAVKRDYRDQLVNRSVKGNPFDIRMTNEGESDYWGLTLALERAFDLGKFGQHQVMFGVTHSKLTGANTNFSSNAGHYFQNTGTFNPFVVRMNGQLMNIEDVDAGNFNPDWTITYTHMASFMDNRLRATVLARYESSAERLYYNGQFKGPTDTYLDYTTKKESPTFNVDMKLSYDFWRYGDVFFTADIEALNLFNRKNVAVDSSSYAVRSGDYAMGRQFFVSLTAQY